VGPTIAATKPRRLQPMLARLILREATLWDSYGK